jgi:hypothetical protein
MSNRSTGRAAFLVGLVLLTAASSFAGQSPRLDVSVSWSALCSGYYDSCLPTGATATLSYNTNDWLSIVGEVGEHYESRVAPNRVFRDVSLTSAMGGVRLRRPTESTVIPFGQLMVGLSRGSSGALNAFSYTAVQLGGGMDVMVSRRVGIRLQGDWRVTVANEPNVGERDLRVAAGILFAFGTRR